MTTQPSGRPLTRASRRRRHVKLTFDKVSFMVVCLGLPLVIFIVLVISPFVQALYYSTTDWSGFTPYMNEIGLANFVQLFQDSTFLSALRNNVLLVIFVPIITLTLAFALACVITLGGPSMGRVRGLKGASFYRVVSFFPYAVPAIVIGLMWAQAFDPSVGLLNGVLSAVGLKGFAGFAWLGTATTALPVSMFVIVWGLIGFYAVVFIAAIKGIPAETYEAARIDGAGRLRMAVSITLPMIRDAVRTAYIYIGILALDAFVYMQALNPQGGPQYSTITMSQDLYVTAFTNGKFGYATAMGVVLAIVTLAFAGVVALVFRLWGGKAETEARA